MAKQHLNISDNFTGLVTKFNQLALEVGDLTGLNTTVDSDIVGAINSVYALIDSDLDVRSKISVANASGDGSLSYSSGTGVITYTGPNTSEVRAHLASGTNTTYDSSAGSFSISDTTIRGKISVTDNGGDGSLSYNSTSGAITYTGPSASEVRAHISVTDAGGDGSLSYSSGTGVITYTGPSATEVRSHFSAGNGITFSSGSIAITAPVRFRLFDSTGSTILDLYGAGSL